MKRTFARANHRVAQQYHEYSGFLLMLAMCRLPVRPCHVLADHGVSGVSTRLAERLEGRRLFDMLRANDTLVVRWVDRLGRNYADVTDTIREFIRRGVIRRLLEGALRLIYAAMWIVAPTTPGELWRSLYAASTTPWLPTSSSSARSMR